ncbi:UNVERIFIED_CONTAM: hypothetical protein GTU68_013317, partial [Idotea baltica]|nr:hypothetical protein [Idotea baltica]
YNTFGVEACAKQFVSIKSQKDLVLFLQDFKDQDFLLLGGGSNVLFTESEYNLVVKLELLGKRIVQKHEEFVFVQSMAGENWHDFVLWTLEQNFGGLENLSLIPGNVGTSPIQNIGAYGVEVKDLVYQVEAIEKATGDLCIFSNEDCDFGYRSSFFKKEGKGKYIIVSVLFKLSEENTPKVGYASLQNYLDEQSIKNPTIHDVSNAVISIRQSKLPDPIKIGNAGSFFKNPICDPEKIRKIEKKYGEVPQYEQSDGSLKVPAGWLIEKAGWKGKKVGNCGVHDKQALVLVNYGSALGSDIYSLAKTIIEDVSSKFGIELQPEVNIL